MANFERSKTFRELVAVVEAEFAAREMSLKPGAAADVLRERVQQVATQMRITPASALRYFTADAVAEMARNTTRMLKEHQASQDALPPVRLTAAQAGLVVSAFTVAARLGVVNGDPDVAADLCEVTTGVSIGLRGGGPVEVYALLLQRTGVGRAARREARRRQLVGAARQEPAGGRRRCGGPAATRPRRNQGVAPHLTLPNASATGLLSTDRHTTPGVRFPTCDFVESTEI